jgi:hypothetical protein
VPVPTDPQIDAMKSAVAVGVPPLTTHMPPPAGPAVTHAAELSFMDGMHFPSTPGPRPSAARSWSFVPVSR